MKKIIKSQRSKISVIVSLLLLVLIFTIPVSAEPIIIKVAYPQAPILWDSPEENAAQAFKGFVDAHSGGEIQVELYPSGALGSEREVMENLSSGLIEIQILGSGAVALFLPEGQMYSLPYLYPSETVAWEVLDSQLTEELSNLLIERHQIRILGLGEQGGFAATTNSRRPIRNADDWEGLKIRTMEDEKQMAMVEALGANPTPISWLETYTSLGTGVVDGQLNPVPVILSGRIYEVQKYITLDRHSYAVMWIVASEQFLQSLPGDLLNIVLEGGKQATIASRGASRVKDAVGLEELKEYLEIYTPTEAEMETFRAHTQQPVLDWLKAQIDEVWIDKLFVEMEKAKTKFGYN